jgi:hypothetical protein
MEMSGQLHIPATLSPRDVTFVSRWTEAVSTPLLPRQKSVPQPDFRTPNNILIVTFEEF